MNLESVTMAVNPLNEDELIPTLKLCIYDHTFWNYLLVDRTLCFVPLILKGTG
jgi:hypothetical protein